MKLDKLLRYGIPQSIVDSWKRTQGVELLPLQSEAVTKHNLLKGTSLIICAPTSSGKTFCGEMAAVANLYRRKKVVFLVPLKAIAEEKYADFVEKYADLGVKVAISTRDRQEHDREIEKGDFDLAVMIFEKFNQLLIRNLDILSLINLIVVDELQMISDPSRGPVLELALTKIRTSGYAPQIVGLSAVLRTAGQLASWLGCELLAEKSRPVELLQGVLLDGTFHFRKFNSGQEGSERLVHVDSEDSHEILFANMRSLLENGEQILVFLKSKRNCEDCALLFSEQSDLRPCMNAIDQLSQLENTTLKEKLIPCLQKGIAFHNADLTFDERKVVESYYLKGEIRAIFSTTTLSLGINLPARTVFIEAQKYEAGEHSGKAVMLPITWSEYENMSGRAGRFGLEKDFGRSIVIAQNKFQFDYLWEAYVEGKEGKIASQLFKRDRGDVILDLIASGAAKSLSQLRQAISSSLDKKFMPHLEDALETKLEELVEKRILSRKTERFSPTRLGSVCALKGISIQTAFSIERALQGPVDPDPFTWFYSVVNTRDGEDIYINVSFWEQQNRVYERALRGRYLNQPPPEAIRSLLEKEMSLSSPEIRLMKLCCLLDEWISDAPTFDLERKYLCLSGQIEQIGRSVSWLLDAACGLGRVLNLDRRLLHFLKRLSLQVNSGVDQGGIQVARLRVPGLGRDYVWRLVKAGFCSLKKVKEAAPEELERVIPREVARRLKERAEQTRRRPERKPSLAHTHKAGKEEEPNLTLDGTPVRDRFMVLIDGKKLSLPAKSFKYLVKLVWAAFKNDDGWIHKTDFEPGENQTRYLHRLKKQILPNMEPGQYFIENNRLGCYRLNIPKDKIGINAPALMKNPDIEIKKMAEELTSWTTWNSPP